MDRADGVRILVAEDNPFYSRMLSATLEEWGYVVTTAADGEDAWGILEEKDGPRLAIVDWMMPRLDGLALCRRVRNASLVAPPYIILLTAKGGKDNIITALEGGADDFISKPFDRMELHARLRVGLRIVSLQERLVAKVDDLENALFQAQKMEAIGRLAGGVAHDFNNLLQIISVAADFLGADQALHTKQRELVQMVNEAADRGACLIRQLLAFSRKQVLQPEILNVNGVIDKVEKLLRRLIGEDIELVTRLESNLALVKADPGQMEQMIMNLVVNARDAMEFGGQVTIETRRVQISDAEAASMLTFRPGSYVLLTVSDTGCGMDADTKTHIFEPFFTTKGPDKGTGLGLATVYGIVRQSGGFIHVDSKPGEGTTFRIYLPLTDGSESPSAGLVPQPTPGKGETILLVEDDDQVRLMVRMALEAHQYTVLEARDGEEALQINESWPDPIHLLLTDVVMPRFSGNQVADSLSRVRPDLKILFMSGYTDDSALHESVVTSGKPFLQKPFTSVNLHHKLRELLNS